MGNLGIVLELFAIVFMLWGIKDELSGIRKALQQLGLSRELNEIKEAIEKKEG